MTSILQPFGALTDESPFGVALARPPIIGTGPRQSMRRAQPRPGPGKNAQFLPFLGALLGASIWASVGTTATTTVGESRKDEAEVLARDPYAYAHIVAPGRGAERGKTGCSLLFHATVLRFRSISAVLFSAPLIWS